MVLKDSENIKNGIVMENRMDGEKLENIIGEITMIMMEMVMAMDSENIIGDITMIMKVMDTGDVNIMAEAEVKP